MVETRQFLTRRCVWPRSDLLRPVLLPIVRHAVLACKLPFGHFGLGTLEWIGVWRPAKRPRRRPLPARPAERRRVRRGGPGGERRPSHCHSEQSLRSRRSAGRNLVFAWLFRAATRRRGPSSQLVGTTTAGTPRGARPAASARAGLPRSGGRQDPALRETPAKAGFRSAYAYTRLEPPLGGVSRSQGSLAPGVRPAARLCTCAVLPRKSGAGAPHFSENSLRSSRMHWYASFSCLPVCGPAHVTTPHRPAPFSCLPMCGPARVTTPRRRPAAPAGSPPSPQLPAPGGPGRAILGLPAPQAQGVGPGRHPAPVPSRSVVGAAPRFSKERSPCVQGVFR